MSEPPDPGLLEPVPEDWNRALAVVAHPDDMEYGAAAAVARWTAQGKHVAYLLVTDGEAGIASMRPEESGPLRRAEQVAGCAEVGVTEVEFLGFPDGRLVEGLELRKALADAIRRHRPEVLLSINFRENFGRPGWNHVDHRVVGRCLLDAARDAANPWSFTELDTEAWGGCRFVAFGGSPRAGHGVDVTDHLAAGIASLRCHEVYLRELGDDAPDPDVFLRDHAAATGSRLGVELASGFEIIPI